MVAGSIFAREHKEVFWPSNKSAFCPAEIKCGDLFGGLNSLFGT
jgi:hypothetical protein